MDHLYLILVGWLRLQAWADLTMCERILQWHRSIRTQQDPVLGIKASSCII